MSKKTQYAMTSSSRSQHGQLLWEICTKWPDGHSMLQHACMGCRVTSRWSSDVIGQPWKENRFSRPPREHLLKMEADKDE